MLFKKAPIATIFTDNQYFTEHYWKMCDVFLKYIYFAIPNIQLPNSFFQFTYILLYV